VTDSGVIYFYHFIFSYKKDASWQHEMLHTVMILHMSLFIFQTGQADTSCPLTGTTASLQ